MIKPWQSIWRAELHMAVSINSGMDRSAVIRTMDRECLRKVPDPYPFVRAHHSIQIVLILLLSLAITSPPATVAAKTAITASRGSNKKNQHQQQ